MLAVMLSLSIIPDASAVAVTARSLASGFRHGLVTMVGIVVGDYVFILIAVTGLNTLADTYSEIFQLIKLLGAGYLFYMGIQILISIPANVTLTEINEPSWKENFTCGLLITLGDPKAILFYLSFLPAFVTIETISVAEVFVVMLIATVAVCVPKIAYMLLAEKSRDYFSNAKNKKLMHTLAGGVMLGTALYLFLKN